MRWDMPASFQFFRTASFGMSSAWLHSDYFTSRNEAIKKDSMKTTYYKLQLITRKRLQIIRNKLTRSIWKKAIRTQHNCFLADCPQYWFSNHWKIVATQSVFPEKNIFNNPWKNFTWSSKIMSKHSHWRCQSRQTGIPTFFQICEFSNEPYVSFVKPVLCENNIFWERSTQNFSEVPVKTQNISGKTYETASLRFFISFVLLGAFKRTASDGHPTTFTREKQLGTGKRFFIDFQKRTQRKPVEIYKIGCACFSAVSPCCAFLNAPGVPKVNCWRKHVRNDLIVNYQLIANFQ